MSKRKLALKGINPCYFYVPQQASKTSIIPPNQKKRNETVNYSSFLKRKFCDK